MNKRQLIVALENLPDDMPILLWEHRDPVALPMLTDCMDVQAHEGPDGTFKTGHIILTQEKDEMQ